MDPFQNLPKQIISLIFQFVISRISDNKILGLVCKKWELIVKKNFLFFFLNIFKKFEGMGIKKRDRLFVCWRREFKKIFASDKKKMQKSDAT